MTRPLRNVESRDPARLRRRPLGRYRYVRLRWRVLFAVVDAVGVILVRAARWFRRPARPDSEVRSILLVQLDHLGDAVLTTAMLPGLRRRFPAASLEVVCGAAGKDVFQAAPEVDRVRVAGVHRFARGKLRRFAWAAAAVWWGLALRRARFDLAIDVRGDFSVAVILWLSGARRRVGWAAGGGGFLLTDSAEFVAGRPEVESRAALLAVLGIDARQEDEPLRPRFTPSDRARRGVGERLERHLSGGCTEAPRVVVHVGAGTLAKAWPEGHFEELVGRLVVEQGAEVILVGGLADRAVAARILGNRPWPGVADWAGELTIDELAALIERADVLVGADSGPAHLAAAVDTPAVVLFSGTNQPQQWQPPGHVVCVLRHAVECSPCHRHRCPRAGHPCMAGIQPQRVVAAVAAVLDGESLDSPCTRRRSAAASVATERPGMARSNTRSHTSGPVNQEMTR